MRITDATIRSLKAPEKGARIYTCDQLDGFGVRVSQAGTKAFVLTYGKHRERITIGRYPVISLQDARAEAKRILAERTLGKRAAKRMRASEALERFLREQAEKNRPITVKYTEALIRNHFPKLLDKYLDDVLTDDVTDVTDKLLKKGQRGAANHAFTAARTFLRWCVKRRYIPHSPLEALDLPSKSGSRERVLSDDELRAVWKAACATGYPFGDIVKLLILTGQRRSEIAALRREWINIPLPGRILDSRPGEKRFDSVGGASASTTECSLPSSKDGEGITSNLTAHLMLQPSVPLAVGGENTGRVLVGLQSPKVGVQNTDCEVMEGCSPSRTGTGHELAPRHQCTIILPAQITKNKRAHTFPIGALSAEILTAQKSSTALFPSRRGNSTCGFSGWSKAKAQLDAKAKISAWTLHDLSVHPGSLRVC